MTQRTIRTATLSMLLAACLFSSGCDHPDPATLEAIPDDVRESIDAAVAGGHRVGIVIGLVNDKGHHFHASGLADMESGAPMTPQTQVGIGSLTKLFTAELLADAVVAGELALDTPVAGLLNVDDPSGTQLWQLATHRAGLPRSLPVAALESHDAGTLFASLAADRTLPAKPAYSNVGYALLGEALAAAAGTPLATLVEARVSAPMSLSDTSYSPSAAGAASPHQGRARVAAPRVPELARGAGGLYSTAQDLLRFLHHHISPGDNSQLDRVALLTGTGLPGNSEALGWKRHRAGSVDVFHHGGDGNGYQAFVAFRPANRTGVVLLTNSSADDALQQIALHLMAPEIPLPRFDHEPSVLLSLEQIAPYAGRFRVEGDGNVIELAATDEGMLYAEYAPDGDTVRESRLFALSETTFELREIRATLHFSDPDSATLKAGGQTFELEREAISKAPE